MLKKIKPTPQSILKKVFGYQNFRMGQLEIINQILNHRDTIAILPTSAGKSLCFQIPALIFAKNKKIITVSIVVSPLVSLMKDQVDSLLKRGILACYINSSLSPKQKYENFQLIILGKINIVYTSPEQLKSLEFIRVIKKVTVKMVVVDEAHCISQWGNNFRPEYKQISQFYKHINKEFVKVAFSATVNKKIQLDIKQSLKLDNPFIFRNKLYRNNLFIKIIDCQSETIKNLILLRIIRNHFNQAGIIYCATKRMTEQLSDFLNKLNIKSTYYHSSISKKKKKLIQNSFISNDTKIIIATNAFGMGIDKPNIRFIVHYQVPGAIENYYQEIGRAGRDTKKSYCYCLYHKKDINIQINLLSKQKQKNVNKLKKIHQFVKTTHCRQDFILKYLDINNNYQCGNCDNCLSKNNTTKHQLLSQTNKDETRLIKKIINQKQIFQKTRTILTDSDACYLSIIKPKNRNQYLAIPGIGVGWLNDWYKIIDPLINSKNDKIRE